MDVLQRPKKLRHSVTACLPLTDGYYVLFASTMRQMFYVQPAVFS